MTRIIDDGNFLTPEEISKLTEKILAVEEKYKELNYHIIVGMTDEALSDRGAQADGEAFGWYYMNHPGEFNEGFAQETVNDIYLYYDSTDPTGNWFHGEFADQWIMTDDDFDALALLDGPYIKAGKYYDAVNAFIDGAEKIFEREANKRAGSEGETETTTVETTTATAEETKETEKVQASDFIPTGNEEANNDPKNPAKFGEWTKIQALSYADNQMHDVYWRVTNITNDPEAVKTAIEDYNKNSSYYQYEVPELEEGIQKEALAVYLLEYELYYPKDFPQKEWGITMSPLNLYIYDTNGERIQYNYKGVDFYGISSYTESLDIRPDEFYAGEIFKGKHMYISLKEEPEYLIEADYPGDADYSTTLKSYVSNER